jgi:hypothetical protein
MDISVQNLQEFEDNAEYGNFLGIGKKAKKIDASTSQIKANTEKLKSDTISQTKLIADQIAEAEKATQDALAKAREVENMASQPMSSSTTSGSSNAPTSTMSKMKLPLIIGGVVLVGIVMVVALRK